MKTQNPGCSNIHTACLPSHSLYSALGISGLISLYLLFLLTIDTMRSPGHFSFLQLLCPNSLFHSFFLTLLLTLSLPVSEAPFPVLSGTHRQPSGRSPSSLNAPSIFLLGCSLRTLLSHSQPSQVVSIFSPHSQTTGLRSRVEVLIASLHHIWATVPLSSSEKL